MSVGIVTRIDESHFYVWALGHGYKEFRCRKVPEKDFKVFLNKYFIFC